MQVEQAANLAAIKANDNATTLKKLDNVMRMYQDADKGVDQQIATQRANIMSNAGTDWQTSQQKLQSTLNANRNAAGTAWNGSGGLNMMQGYDRADDMADVQLIKSATDNLDQLYLDEAEAKQRNANARNEFLADLEASLGLSLSDYVAQLASISPSLVSGVYGDADEIEETKGLFPYRAQADTDKDLDTAEDLSSLTDLAKRNMQESNYDFPPLIDREKREIVAPFWWPNIDFQSYWASPVVPRREGFVRAGDETERVRKAGGTKATESGSAASKKSGLAAYLNGYSNRQM